MIGTIMEKSMNRENDLALATAPEAETLPERIEKLLGQGFPTTVVASAVGCDPSYVSQLMEIEEFKTRVLILRAARAEKSVARDNSWDQVEDLALEKALTMLPLLSRPTDLVRLASYANSAKRRSSDYSGMGESNAPVVNIVLPKGATVHFQMNTSAQVVEVDGRSMAALPTKNLTEALRERREQRDALGTIDVAAGDVTLFKHPPTLETPTTVKTERKKVETILEKIGFAEDTVPVPKILGGNKEK